MTLSDVDKIQLALDELGLALIRPASEEFMWTLHQRKLYEQATQTLNQERTRLRGNGT